jgi:hypothetical protein
MDSNSTARRDVTIDIGDDLKTRAPVAFPWHAFARGGYFTGQSGQGKSSTICRLLTEVTGRGAPAIIIDDAGETFQQLERFAAYRAAEINAALVGQNMPEHVRRQVLQRHVLDRFTFGFIGHSRENRIGIDILKRRQLPHRRESVEEVVLAALKPFEARFRDMEIRTKFVWVVKPLLTALVAGERPITEALTLLFEPQYWWFLLREIERLKTLDEPRSREYVVPRLETLRRILDLRRNKEGIEAEPFPQRFFDKVDSTIHALEVFQPGTIVGSFFEDDTFASEDVVFGNGVFALTSDVSSELGRNLALACVYTYFERLMGYRLPSMRDELHRLYVVLDEIRWFHEGLTRFLSVARNHKISTFILNQQDDQWEQLGMSALANVIPSLLRFRVQYRAATREAADRMARMAGLYDPFGMLRYETTRGRGWSKSVAHGETESFSDTDSDDEGTSWGGGNSRDLQTFEMSENWSNGGSRRKGTSSTMGSAYNTVENEGESEQENEQILSASVNDQHFLRMQEMETLPEHCALVSFEGKSRLVRMRPFTSYATARGGVDWLGWIQRAANRTAARLRARRPRYDRAITIFREPAAPEAPEEVRPGKREPDAAPARRTGERRKRSDGR